ncbi:polysaccharide pyruvyl transferase family protein [Chitinophaga rhizosphaerae]|uniref:polysaccharide pyruvyl transferase family protein n=1 Tax=Chitinophaga rhizosphaerae TaxID=1864947 RepID=UPI0013DE9AFF|nr:polysaccharide pyruvyl transferase family protein [Chitinophaga rhizosphaerae]
MQNKGEEAILRGYESMIHASYPGQYELTWGILDDTPTVKTVGNVTIFPRRWVENSVWPSKYYRYNRVIWDFLYAIGLEGKIRNMHTSNPDMKQLADFWRDMDLMIVGHDGYFKPASAMLLIKAQREGKRSGILGSGFYHLPAGGWREKIQRKVYSQCMAVADFAVFRESTPYKYMKALAPAGSVDAVLAPDPAFLMAPAAPAIVQEVLGKYNWYTSLRRANRPFIGATVCQNDIHTMPFMQKWNSDMEGYWKYLAGIFDDFIEKTGEQVIFLPHSIVPGKNDDVENARIVISNMRHAASCIVMEDDLPATTLKGIICQLDFLIGQRTHSLIGSVGVQTAAVAITSSRDGRTHEILKDFAGFSENIINIDEVPAQKAGEIAIQNYQNRVKLKEEVTRHYQQIREQLMAVSSGLIK